MTKPGHGEKGKKFSNDILYENSDDEDDENELQIVENSIKEETPPISTNTGILDSSNNSSEKKEKKTAGGGKKKGGKKKKGNKKDEDDDDEYETVVVDKKDLIELRPYSEYKKAIENKLYGEDNDEDGFLNDYNIFESDLLNNRQSEFLNYDYINIQKKLREYCDLRFKDDAIFNANLEFFKQFN